MRILSENLCQKVLPYHVYGLTFVLGFHPKLHYRTQLLIKVVTG